MGKSAYCKLSIQALKSAHIDIVGGESTFFDKIVNAVANGKSVDRFIDSSDALTDVKDTLFTGDSATFTKKIKEFASQFGMTSEDLKNLTVSALLTKMTTMTEDKGTLWSLHKMLASAKESGMADKLVSKVLGKK